MHTKSVWWRWIHFVFLRNTTGFFLLFFGGGCGMSGGAEHGVRLCIRHTFHYHFHFHSLNLLLLLFPRNCPPCVPNSQSACCPHTHTTGTQTRAGHGRGEIVVHGKKKSQHKDCHPVYDAHWVTQTHGAQALAPSHRRSKLYIFHQ